MKQTLLTISLVTGLLLTSSIAFSQPSGGGAGDGGDPDVPIGGIELLLLGGLALGIKKLSKKK